MIIESIETHSTNNGTNYAGELSMKLHFVLHSVVFILVNGDLNTENDMGDEV